MGPGQIRIDGAQEVVVKDVGERAMSQIMTKSCYRYIVDVLIADLQLRLLLLFEFLH